MRLELETGDVFDDPDDQTIDDAIRGASDGFIILSISELEYIQAAGSPDEGYVLEYQEGDTDRHYQAAELNVPVDRVVRAFQQYASGDPGYKARFTWEKILI